MKFRKNFFLIVALAFSIFAISSCDKTKPYDITIPSSEVHFVDNASRTIQIVDDPVPVFNLQIGTTDVSSQDRTVTYKVSSNSAVAGTHYTIASGAPTGTVTIPAGEAIATIAIQPIYAAFPIDAVDTLYFTLSEPSITPAKFQDTVRLIIKGPSSSSCSEAAPVMDDFRGDFTNTNELFGTDTWGPYTTSVTNAVLTSPTTGIIDVENIYDLGFGAIQFKLDWSDPATPIATVIAADVPGADAGDVFGPTYAGIPLSVRPHPSNPIGSYSYCDQKLILPMQFGMASRGLWATDVLIETLER